MTELTVWLKHHDACGPGFDWAVNSCNTMQDVWDNAKPEWLIWVATRRGTLTPQMQRKFGCWCVRQIWHLLTDERSKNAVIVAEKHADGTATDGELSAARAAAVAAARAAAWAAAGDAAGDAAVAAARAAAWAAAEDAAWAAARAAARAAAGDAAWAAAEDAQSQWLRKNCTPNFNLEINT